MAPSHATPRHNAVLPEPPLLTLAEQSRGGAPTSGEAAGEATIASGRPPQPQRPHDLAEPSWLLTTKLFVPRPPVNPVVRCRLSERLAGIIAVPLTVAADPAGCGKSTLLATWLASLPEPSSSADGKPALRSPLDALRPAWLTLDAGDNDLATFLHYLVAALRRAVPGVGAGFLAQLQPPLPPLNTLLAPC